MTFKYVNKSQNEEPLFKKHPSDAGWDIRANENVVIYPGETVAVSTGLFMAFDEGKFGQIVDRSGLALSGISTRAGIIDAPYRDEVKVVLHNERPRLELEYSMFGETFEIKDLRYKNRFEITVGDRIAQLIERDVDLTQPQKVDILDKTGRGSGFGSSGVR